MRAGATLTTIATVALATPSIAAAGYGPAEPGPDDGGDVAAEVRAEGNVFTGGLRFRPPAVSVRVGDVIRWRNTDFIAPHTATEDHGLWDLGGDYGETPFNPSGFGPGETVQRRFAAGSWTYFCRVHPQQMRGSVAVPVRLRAAGRRRRAGLRARWARQRLPAGQVFDVQRRRGGGKWRTVRSGTRRPAGRFRSGRRGTVWAFRARVRSGEERAARSGWSPAARIRTGAARPRS